MSIKFIDKSYLGADAEGGTELTTIGLGNMFRGDLEDEAFRLGNTGAGSVDLTVTASGLNAALVAAAEFSLNKADFETSVTLSGVVPNQISDTIWMRFTAPIDSNTTSGTFLIRVDES